MKTLSSERLDEWIKEAHNNSTQKGFWGKGQEDIDMKLGLIMSEVGEAIEAHRKDRKSRYAQFNGHLYDNLTPEGRLQITQIRRAEFKTLREVKTYVDDFESYMKDTLEDELADVLIRCFDLLGKLYNMTGREPEKIYDEIASIDVVRGFNPMKETLSGYLFCIVKGLLGIHSLPEFIVGIWDLGEVLGMDLAYQIEMKMLYNQTRDKLHGKKY